MEREEGSDWEAKERNEVDLPPINSWGFSPNFFRYPIPGRLRPKCLEYLNKEFKHIKGRVSHKEYEKMKGDAWELCVR